MKLKHLFVNIIGKLTGYYNYGKHNKVIFIKKGKPTKRIFMPKGLTLMIEGNDNEVIIEKPLKFENALINLEGNNGIFNMKHSKHKVKDAKLYVASNCKIIIGENCQLKNGNLVMIANRAYKEPAQIILGNNVYIARNALFRTSDGHTIIDAETKAPLNPTDNIVLDDNVWITSNCTILKGTHIPKGCIVGACSLVNKKFEEENCIIAGTPAKIIKHNVTWDAYGYGRYAKKYYEERES